MKTNKEENYDILIELMEENPMLFYDTSELEDLGNMGNFSEHILSNLTFKK